VTASSIRIIGVGSPQGDDWVGWELAERLRASETLAPWSERISISLHDRPGAALLQVWRGGGQVILLDAVRSGAVPGTVHRFDTADLMTQPRQLSTHGFGVADAVQLAAALDALPEALRFFGVEADPAHTEMCLSDAVHAVLPALVEEIEALVQSWLRSDSVPR
jgi:hydrogenase maturation protease